MVYSTTPLLVKDLGYFRFLCYCTQSHTADTFLFLLPGTFISAGRFLAVQCMSQGTFYISWLPSVFHLNSHIPVTQGRGLQSVPCVWFLVLALSVWPWAHRPTSLWPGSLWNGDGKEPLLGSRWGLKERGCLDTQGMPEYLMDAVGLAAGIIWMNIWVVSNFHPLK